MSKEDARVDIQRYQRPGVFGRSGDGEFHHLAVNAAVPERLAERATDVD
jgi:hypothetical protein